MPTRIVGHPWGWASLAPILCAIHCLAAPVLVVTVPALADNAALETAFLLVTVVVAAAALITGLRRHGRLSPLLPVGVGLLAWTASLMHVLHPLPEEGTTFLAAMLVAGGLLWNARLGCVPGKAPGGACESCHLTETLPEGIPEGEVAASSSTSGG